MSSLYRRQLITICYVVVFAFVGVSFGVFTTSRMLVDNEQGQTARRQAQFLAAFTSGFIERESIAGEYYRNYLKSIALVSDCFIFVTEIYGTTSYATDGEYFYPIERNDVSRAVVDEITATNTFEGVSDLGGIFTEERFLYGVTYTENQGGIGVPVGFVVVSPNTERLDSIWHSVGLLYYFFLLVMLISTMVLATYFAAIQVRPINELAVAARRFGQGELSVRVTGYETRKDEIGALAREFNAMASSLAEVDSQRSSFISNVSHELKTPMTTISGFAEGLLDGTVPEHHREKALELIVRETRRLSRLTQEMLDLSKMDADQEKKIVSRPFDLVEVLAQVIISLEGKIISRGLDIDVQIPEGELMAWGCPDAITQVFTNLLDNAIKFAEENSVIVVAIKEEHEKVFTSVSNIGENIKAEDLPHLFQRFHKQDYSRSIHRDGLGLGLYIVKCIMASLQESITVTCVEGVTEFTFSLSLVDKHGTV